MRSPDRARRTSARPSQRTSSPAKLLESRAARYAAVLEQERSVLFPVVTFRRGSGTYALPLTELKEIRPLTRWCAIPGASAVVPGVVYCRGELLSLHDLACFADREAKREAPVWVLVAEHRNKRLGVMADDVMDVVDIEVGAVHSAPVTLGDAAELFLGMTSGGVLILEGARMFEVGRFAKAF